MPFVVNHDGGSTTAWVNQKKIDEKYHWRRIGMFNYTGGQTYTIEIHDGISKSFKDIMADAAFQASGADIHYLEKKLGL